MRRQALFKQLPRRCSAVSGLAIACLLSLPGLGCALHGQGSAAQAANTASANPMQWVGRWQGTGSQTLRIMPDRNDGYQVTIRSSQGIRTHYQATATRGKLLFNRGGNVLAIQRGIGRNTGEPTLAKLTNCLLVTPDGHGYCRRAGTADALPLARGAYVTVKTRCRNAQRADVLYFNGHALLRAGQRACRAAIVSQQGIVFHLNDTCAADNDSARQSPNETVSVPDRHDLALETAGGPTRLYRYCAAGLLPPDLQTANARQDQ